jgi:hypothetical protein
VYGSAVLKPGLTPDEWLRLLMFGAVLILVVLAAWAIIKWI